MKCIKCNSEDNSTETNIEDLGYEFEQYPHYRKEWDDSDSTGMLETCICKKCLLEHYELWDEVPYEMWALPNNFGSYSQNGKRHIGVYGIKFNRDKWAWTIPIKLNYDKSYVWDIDETYEEIVNLKDLYDVAGIDDLGSCYIDTFVKIDDVEYTLSGLIGSHGDVTTAFRTPKEVKEVALCDL